MPQGLQTKPIEVELPNGQVITEQVDASLTGERLYSVLEGMIKARGGVKKLMGPIGQAPTAPAEGAPALPRFLSNLAESVDPRGLLEAVKHPAQTAQGIGRAHLETGKKFVTALKEGRLSEAAGYGLSSILPAIGPGLANIGEQIGSGDIAGGLGAALGMALPTPKIARTGKVMTATKIPRSFAERTGRLGRLEAVVESVPGGSAVFKRFRQLQDSKATAAANSLIESVAKGGRKLDEVETGAVFIKAVEDAERAIIAPAKPLYAKIDAELGTTMQGAGRVSAVMPETRKLKEFAENLGARLGDEANLLDPNDLSSVRRTLDSILKSPASLPFQAFQDARSDLLRAARAFDDPLPGKKAGVVKELAALTDQSMREALIKSGRTDLLTTLEDANRIYREGAELMHSKIIERVLKTDPDRVPALLLRTGREDLALLRKVVPKEQFDNAAAVVLRDQILEPAISGQFSDELLAKFKVGGMAEEGKISSRILAGKIKGAKARIGSLIGDAVANDLVGLTEELIKIRQKIKPPVAAQLIAGGAIIGPVAGAITSMVTGNPAGITAGLGGAGAMIASANVLARLLVKQPRSRPMLRSVLSSLGSSMGRQDVRAALAGLNRIEAMNNEENKAGRETERR